jgi:hypothetical protein
MPHFKPRISPKKEGNFGFGEEMTPTTLKSLSPMDYC